MSRFRVVHRVDNHEQNFYMSRLRAAEMRE